MAFRFAWVLAFFLLTPLAAADGLYTGQVPVASQSEADTAAGLSTALAQVLATLSGDKAALNRPGVAKAVAQPNRYVQQYHFAQSADNGQRLMLVAQFDQVAEPAAILDEPHQHSGSNHFHYQLSTSDHQRRSEIDELLN